MNSKFYEISYNLEKRYVKYCSDNLSIFLNHIRIKAVIYYTVDPKGSKNCPFVSTFVCSIYFILILYEYFSKKPLTSISKSKNYLATIITNFLFSIFMV